MEIYATYMPMEVQLLSLRDLAFFIFEIPLVIYHVNATQPSEGMSISVAVFFSLWSTTSGATVIIHISMAQICGRKRKPITPVHDSATHPLFRMQVSTESHVNSATRFSLPPQSV